MNSKESIKSDLRNVAKNYEYEGEAVDMIIDMLTYSLYHEQFDFMNIAREMSLSQATLINSKIALCDNVMYSVYRGKNPRIFLNVKADTVVNINKYDLLFERPSFYCYAAKQYNLYPDDEYHLIEGILSKIPIIDTTYEISDSSHYHLDITLNTVFKDLHSNLSEDLQISVIEKGQNTSTLIENKVYKTTRIFSDHTKYNYEGEEIMFTLTLPDYGIRLYRKDLFPLCAKIRFQGFTYCDLKELNARDIKGAAIDGLTLYPIKWVNGNIDQSEFDAEVEDADGGYDVVRNQEYVDLKYNSTTMELYGFTLRDCVERESARSLLYNANLCSRVNSEIKSNSDVNYLFSEIYKDKVDSSNFKFYRSYETEDGEVLADTLEIIYIERIGAEPITELEKQDFLTEYGAYFLSKNTLFKLAKNNIISVAIEVVLNNTESILNEVKAIYSEYEMRMETSFNFNKVISSINKIDNVNYVSSITYKDQTGKILNQLDINDLATYDSYFTFNININYSEL